MEHKYQLSCESTVDLPYSYISSRGISVLFYTYTADGKEYVDNMGRDPEDRRKFFEMLQAGIQPSTSQINTYRYLDFFDKLLQKGDVLHIAFGSGMTPSVNNAMEAAEMLREKYPERKLVIIDSLCSSGGYGLLVETAADMWDDGKSIDELEDWILTARSTVHHQFFCTDLTQFKRSGRVSGPVALAGNLLNLCPIMHLNREGKIIAYAKVRGKNKAVAVTADTIAADISNGDKYSQKCYILHSDCIELAEATKTALTERLPNAGPRFQIGEIGTIISAHCGPKTVAVFFFGNEIVE